MASSLLLNPFFSIAPKSLIRNNVRYKTIIMAHYDPRDSSNFTISSSQKCYESKEGFLGEKSTISPYEESTSEGIGIVKFFDGKVLFITGATGFLAKVLAEKILRSVPNVKKIYLLMRGQSKEDATNRLKNEILNVQLFKQLRQIHGKSYEAFMLSKLVPVVGNVCESNLGIEDVLAEDIASDVDFIINSAANTTFDERYDVALAVNTGGPCHMMNFSKTCKKLKLFVQISTAYVNKNCNGRILEKAFNIGNQATEENTGIESSMVDVEVEMKLGLHSEDDTLSSTKKMKDLGLERARRHGWQNTYEFTKAMGEMKIDKMRGEIPVVIIRPSIIESTYREPFPGWIEGNRMIDPILSLYGKGVLTGFLFDPSATIDVVPCDIVANATFAAMAKHGLSMKPEINIYHICSSAINPLLLGDLLLSYFYEHFDAFPWVNTEGREINVERMEVLSSLDDFNTYVSRNLHLYDAKSSKTVSKKLVEILKYLAEIYEPYAFFRGRFDNSNMQDLMEDMSKDERASFGCDLGNIDWKNYICNIHIPGLRTHVLKDSKMIG